MTSPGVQAKGQPQMHLFRRFFPRHQYFAAVLLALALCLKAVVPTGYMVDASGTSLTIRICDGQSNRVVKLAIPGRQDDSHQQRANEASHCPYTALSLGALGGADPWLIEVALAFLLLLGLAPLVAPVLRRQRYHTPPLRAPPLPA